MKPVTPLKRKTLFWIIHVSGWLFYTVLAFIFGYRERLTDIPQLLYFTLPYAAGFLVCIPMRFVYKKIRIHERPLKYSITAALGTSFAGSNLWMGLLILISMILPMPSETPMPFIQIYMINVLSGGMLLLGWTFLYLGIKTGMEWKDQEERAKKANDLAQNAQLQMLRYQLNPHFLFNSMNSIRALIDEDDQKAREMITELSEFLRYSLDSKDYADIPLKNEIDAVKHYFAIQKKRYEDKLEVIYDIEPQAETYPVLSFLIHPLVENAVKYGMRTSSMPLSIHLKAKITDGSLWIEISNTGKWIEPEDRKDQPDDSTGTGVDNVRRRLENAFPGRHRFEVVEKEGKVHVQLEIKSKAEKNG
ncbi:MAG: histidine kinase [Candidatus Aminicenantes bacterium]|nr:histidine kinase [Candidatus Aminicenantes bacterium]